MRFSPILAAYTVWALVCLLPMPAVAQSPLTTTFFGGNGVVDGGMVFFDLQVTNPAGITIKQLDVNTTATAGAFHVFTAPQSYVGIAATPSAWTDAAHGTVDPAGIDNPSRVCLGGGFFLPPGTHAIAVWGRDVGQRYTNSGLAPLVYTNADVTLTTGAATNTQWGGLQFTPRVWNGSIFYDVGQTLTFSCAYTESQGVGCNKGATTWYEYFPDLSVFDMAGTFASPTTWRATVAGPAGYVAVPSSSQWVTPSGPQLLDNAPTQGPLALNELTEPLQLPFTFAFPGGSTNVVHASANGWILLEPTATHWSFNPPFVGSLLDQEPRICPLWSFMDPQANLPTNPASGVYFDVDSSNQFVVITWLDMGDSRMGPPAAGTTSVNVQCVLYSSGDYEFRYGPIVPIVSPVPLIVGWSKGGGSGPIPDPGSSDLSTGIPVLTTGPDNFALEHWAGVARLGTTVDLTVDHVESLAPLAFLFVGDVLLVPGVDLAVIGAPDCFAYTNILATATVAVSGSSGTGAFSLSVPNSTALVGMELISQYGSLTLRNALNLSTSNAVRFLVGN